MSMHQYAGHPIETNDEGFLLDPAQWTPQIGEAIAHELGMDLTQEHWKVITFCREDAAKQGGLSPGLRRISMQSGVNMKDLYRLFPKGPGKLAARVAGLPKPKSCL